MVSKLRIIWKQTVVVVATRRASFAARRCRSAFASASAAAAAASCCRCCCASRCSASSICVFASVSLLCDKRASACFDIGRRRRLGHGAACADCGGGRGCEHAHRCVRADRAHSAGALARARESLPICIGKISRACFLLSNIYMRARVVYNVYWKDHLCMVLGWFLFIRPQPSWREPRVCSRARSRRRRASGSSVAPSAAGLLARRLWRT